MELQTQRNEEVQHIIDRMPTRFGIAVSSIALFIFILILIFGWLVRYPDVVNGQIIINANSSPVKLISNSSGKLRLSKFKTSDEVKEGEIVAFIDNPTNPTNVTAISTILKTFNPNGEDVSTIQIKLPHNVSLGELNLKYYAFINALQEFTNYKQDKLYDKRGQNLLDLLQEQKKAFATSEKRVVMAKNTLLYVHKFYKRDSLLFVKKVISEAELDKTQMSYLSGKDALEVAVNNLINIKQSIQQTEGKLQELGIQKPEKNKELRIALISTYNDLMDNIKSWEQKYVFKAPFNGKVQFLKFYSENQFVQSGEEVFTIVPKEDHIIGQVILPAQGSGKVKFGQEVIVKLDNYPYLEYGSIKGTVNTIALTTNVTKTEKSNIDTYQVLVSFPNQLKTNYGVNLEFRAEAKGSAEIITNDRRLIQRLFDNLKYIMKK